VRSASGCSRPLGAYGELTAAEVAFVKALDLPNLTLAAL
jgi:hypothetical protein